MFEGSVCSTYLSGYDGDSDDRPNQQEPFDKGLVFFELLPTFYLVGYVLHFPVKLLWQRYKHIFLGRRQTPEPLPTDTIHLDKEY